MAALKTFLLLMSLGARAHTAAVTETPSVRADDVTLSLVPILTGGFQLVLIGENEREILGQIGRTLVSPFTTEDIEGGLLVRVGSVNLTIHTLYDTTSKARGIKFSWEADQNTRLEDCIDFGSKHWYAGPMQVDQVYPIETSTQVYRPSYIQETDNGAIMERYWLNSAGGYVIVHDKVPLFVDYKNILNNHLCFGAQLASPYTVSRPRTLLAYDLWFLPNVKEAHKHAVANYLGKPSATPDYEMVKHPIWSTWAQYSREINTTKLLDFAEQIRDNGFNNSQFEIDDQWETCYGSLEVNEEKFPDFNQTVRDLKALGYRVTIWAHPFINRNCDPWYSEALEKGYFVLDQDFNSITSWWNNNGTVAGYIDFTNPTAANWYSDRLRAVLDTYDIDSVKFDAGEASFAPEISIQTGDIELQPHHLVQQYASVCAAFGDMVEVRAGFRTQDLPIYVRMVDRDSIWGLNNGLSTIITTTFQMNLNGYPFVLPDMIGGNGYNLDHEQADLPTKELFIRWVQANTFLPVMQYSFAPWNFDEEILVALNFYARGSYQGSVGQNDDAPMAQQTVSRCIRQVSLAMNTPEILRKYIKFPQNATERNVIKRKFCGKYNLPGVIGCIDCSHIAIVRPSEHEERFFNRKHFHSINTQVTVNISKKYTELHAEYADVIFQAMEKAVADGTPVNTPLWWIDPTDEDALVIWDEYLLAETVLVAPILTEGARSRDIYIPTGTWYEEGDEDRVIEGPIWLSNYPAPIDVLPYFVRDKTKSTDSGVSLYTSAVLVLLGLMTNIIRVL